MSLEPTWNLEALYPDTQSWEEDFMRIEPAAQTFYAYRGKLSESAEILAQAIEAQDNLQRIAEKCYCYAHLRSDEDTSIGINRSRVDRISSLMAKLSKYEAWFEPEIMAIDDEKMNFLLSKSELSLYKRSILELLRFKPHTLSESEERLLGTLSDVLGNAGDIFSTLNDTDLDFGQISDNNGKLMPLTHGSYRRFLESPNREVRRNAFHKLYQVYRQFRHTFANTLAGEINHHVVCADIRHYNSPLEAALYPDNIPENVYTGLIDTVHNHLDDFKDYLDFRRNQLGLDTLDMYDLQTPLVDSISRDYEFPEAVELVCQACKPLGEGYMEKLNLAFKQRWIDVPERKGKRSGAYSGGCFDSYPYLLLNYNKTLNDVFTLAHELGHSMHSFYSNSTQPYHYADYEIFVAEVASTTNEILLFEHLLENTHDRSFQAYLYGHLADEIRATIYRQTMFAEFELKIHQTVQAGIPLTAEFLNEEYYQLNELYHPGIKPDQDIELEWARIPHFYYNFYVYKYATGMSAAIQLAAGLRSGDPQKREAYLEFLKAGSSKDVLNIMKDAGVDLTTPQPVSSALDYFKSITNRLKSIMQR